MAWSKEYYESTRFRLFGLVKNLLSTLLLKFSFVRNCTCDRYWIFETEDHNCSWNKFSVRSWNCSDCWFICFGLRGCETWLLPWWESFCPIRLVLKWFPCSRAPSRESLFGNLYSKLWVARFRKITQRSQWRHLDNTNDWNCSSYGNGASWFSRWPYRSLADYLSDDRFCMNRTSIAPVKRPAGFNL